MVPLLEYLCGAIQVQYNSMQYHNDKAGYQKKTIKIDTLKIIKRDHNCRTNNRMINAAGFQREIKIDTIQENPMNARLLPSVQGTIRSLHNLTPQARARYRRHKNWLEPKWLRRRVWAGLSVYIYIYIYHTNPLGYRWFRSSFNQITSLPTLSPGLRSGPPGSGTGLNNFP